MPAMKSRSKRSRSRGLRIYLDHAATTPLDERVMEAMKPYFSGMYGNASSLHSFGRECDEAVEKARLAAARVIGASSAEITFTSGGSESNNTVIKSLKRGDHLVTTAIEHHCVLYAARAVQQRGVEVTYLPVDREGFITPEQVSAAIRKNTRLVSVMHANNEIGTIEPVAEIGKLCREKGVLFHTDAVQTFGKIPLDVRRMNTDFLSASAHKLYGPKGVGLLYIREGLEIEPLIHGGSQEGGRRAGTENVPGIVGFGKAANLALGDMASEASRQSRLRDRLIRGCLGIPRSWLNGPGIPGKGRLPNNANLGFEGIEGEAMVLHLDMKGVAASTGSACSSESLEPSHVLLAIGLPHARAHGSLRLTLGRQTMEGDVEYTLGVLPEIVRQLRAISPYGNK
jgi:cysteine desulfurase